MVKIVEFNQSPPSDFKFDLVDDAIFYMRNDPSFYRKQYFPTMAKMADIESAGKKVDKSSIEPMISRGITSYCKKYNLGRHPDDVFTQDHRMNILDRIMQEEYDNIKKGMYK